MRVCVGHRYTTPNRDWKRITRTKNRRVFEFPYMLHSFFCLLQRLDARQTNKKCTIDSREAVADATSSS